MRHPGSGNALTDERAEHGLWRAALKVPCYHQGSRHYPYAPVCRPEVSGSIADTPQNHPGRIYGVVDLGRIRSEQDIIDRVLCPYFQLFQLKIAGSTNGRAVSFRDTYWDSNA